MKDPLDWLLEPEDTGVRYLALRDLVGAGGAELEEARHKAHAEGPIAQLLSAMHPDGYWEKPGPGYNPKYSGSVWSVVLLAQLGASPQADPRVAAAGDYLLKYNLTGNGQFTINGQPSGTVDCVQGNLCASLLDLGCDYARLEKAFEWMARSTTGEGVAPMTEKNAPVRYYSGKCGPGFLCGGNNKQACAWGAVKVMRAFGKLPRAQRTPLVDRAIETGIGFLLGTDPAAAEYPCGWASKPSGNWWKFGFPVFYITDMLQNVEALVSLGRGADPRLANALNLIREKRDEQGRWPLEYDYKGKVLPDFGVKKQPSKWVTLRALHVLRAVA